MKRVLGPLLVGLGVFLLALAVLLPTVVVPRVEKAPADTYSVTRATGTGSYLNPETLQIVRNADVTVTRVFRGDVENSNDDVAMYDHTQTLEVSGLDDPLDVVAERVRFDRESGIGVGGQGDRPNHEGAYTVKLPFNTEKGEYLYHEPSAGRAFPVTFERETEVDGLEVYEFRGTIEGEITSEISVPGRLVGSTAASIFVEEVYSNEERVLLVEPRTGSIVGLTSKPRRTWQPSQFGGQSGADTVVFEADLTPTDETTAELVADAKDAKGQLDLLGRTLPIALGILGLVLLLGGIAALGASRRRPGHAGY